MYTILVFSLATTGTMAWTASTGGEIRHTEIRADTVGIVAPESDND